MPYRVIGAEIEPITLEEARNHLRLDADSDSDGHPDDSLIENVYLPAARQFCEDFLGWSIAYKTIELALDKFPDDFELLYPANSIVSVKYIDSDGDEQTLDPDGYTLDGYSNPSWLIINNGYSWPSVSAVPNAVKVIYTTGYGVDSDADQVPFAIKAAILLQLGHLYENREDATDKPITSIANGVESLLRPLRTRLGMA